MTPLQFASYVRYKTKTDSDTFTDADILALMAVHMDDIASEIIKLHEDYFGTPYLTNLVANRREYPLPSDILSNIKAVEAKLDGTNFVTLDELDLNTYHRVTTEAQITSDFSNDQGSAFYDLFRGSLWLYSGTIIDVTDGLKLWAFSWPAHVSDLSSTVDMSIDPDTSSHGFPRQFHKILADRVVVDFKESGETQIPLTQTEQMLELAMQKKLSSMKDPNESRSVIGKLPMDLDYGNDGADL